MNPPRKASLFLTAIAICCCFAAPAEANGPLRRLLSRQNDSCPGPNCPTGFQGNVQVERTRQVSRTNESVSSDLVAQHNALHGGGSWTWPGGTEESLRQHLATDHGQAQTQTRTATRSRTVTRGNYQTTAATTSYGSSGGTSFRVGGRDKDGYVITSIGVARTVAVAPVCDCGVTVTATIVPSTPSRITVYPGVDLEAAAEYTKTSPVVQTPTVAPAVPTPVAVKAKNQFREELVKAIQSARKAGKITVVEAAKLRTATLSPAFVERAHDLAVTQIAFSGEVNENVPVNAEGAVQVEGINWEGLTKFMEALVPLLIMLLKAFGAMS